MQLHFNFRGDRWGHPLLQKKIGLKVAVLHYYLTYFRSTIQLVLYPEPSQFLFILLFMRIVGSSDYHEPRLHHIATYIAECNTVECIQRPKIVLSDMDKVSHITHTNICDLYS